MLYVAMFKTHSLTFKSYIRTTERLILPATVPGLYINKPMKSIKTIWKGVIDWITAHKTRFFLLSGVLALIFILVFDYLEKPSRGDIKATYSTIPRRDR